ncbi:Uncharacterised protein [uncultured archaeon]|nr:Uncharacterised protein [uncultured archaeon]
MTIFNLIKDSIFIIMLNNDAIKSIQNNKINVFQILPNKSLLGKVK